MSDTDSACWRSSEKGEEGPRRGEKEGPGGCSRQVRGVRKPGCVCVKNVETHCCRVEVGGLQGQAEELGLDFPGAREPLRIC